MTIQVEVMWSVDDTTKTDIFYAAGAWTTVHPTGRTVVDLIDGRDVDGPVSGVTYQKAYRVLRRPVIKEET